MEWGTSNILHDKSHKMKCVIKTTQTPSKELVEKDTMTAAEDIEEAGKTFFEHYAKKREMPVTTARLRNFKRRGRWSSMLSAALDIKILILTMTMKDVNDSKQKIL